MKHLSMAMLTGLMLASLAVQPAAAGVCLNVKSIRNSDVAKDGRAITFEMKDGKIWRNDLKGQCPDLWFNGFSWRVQADTVCDDEPGLRVIHSGQICQLGKFTAMTPAS